MKTITKISALLASTVSVVMPTHAYANLVITEYVEGSGNNKAIELSNLSNTTIDLAQQNYKLALYANGATSASSSQVLTGILAPNQSLVLYNANATEEFKLPAPTGVASSVTSFNGDDTLLLFQGSVVVDSFGKLGHDPGTAWTRKSFSSQNQTLRRKASTLSGDDAYSDSFPGRRHDWLSFAIDTADGLGCPGEVACPKQSPILITEYVEGSSNNKAIELTNMTAQDIDLNAENIHVELYSNGTTTPSQTEWLNGTLAAGQSFVIYNAAAAAEFQFSAPNGIASTVTYFNGDDALVLKQGSRVLDSIGRVGEDPGSAWTHGSVPEFSTANKTLRRKSDIQLGDDTPTDTYPTNASQWLVLASDTADGLGCAGESACPSEEPVESVCVNCPPVSKVAEASSFVDSDYYAAALSSSPTGLRSAINGIIAANHKQLTYSEVWSVLTYTDEDPNNANNVIEIYTGNSIAKFSNGSGEQASNPDAWNREHIWAKSHGFPDRSQLGYTDVHHLRPADISVNAARSNYDFADGGVPLTESPANSYDETLRTWEPRAQVKGDVARMMFYMDIRYEGAAADSTPDLVLVDNIGTENGTPLFGKLCTLYQWHLDDPVDAFETKRNNTAYEYQGNRNPFIDHPEWIAQLYASQCGQ